LEEAVSEEYRKELREKMLTYKKEKEDELLNKEKEWKEMMAQKEKETLLQLQKEKEKFKLELEQNVRKSIGADYENKLILLEQNNRDNEEKLKASRQKELEFLQKEKFLKEKEAELELTTQRKIQQEREKIGEEIRNIELQKSLVKETGHQLRVKELEKQLEDQRKLAEEMKRKADQGSMQLQGEAQELVLEDKLREYFPFDTVVSVGKGVEGADCILIVRNNVGSECGKIIFESKRTKGWNSVWIDKLKNDMRIKQADLAILVTQVFPKGMDCFGEKDGVWLCSFKELSGLAAALRNAILRIAETRKSEENKGEKMQMLYNYLTGLEFRQHIEAIVEGFVSMRNSITKERVQMEKIWKEREKQLDKVLMNTSGMYGSVKGIAGASVQNIPLLEGRGSDDMDDDDMAH
jgi:hypothetical protein